MQEYFFIRENRVCIKVLLDELAYIEAYTNYVKIHTTHKTYTTLLAIKQLAQFLPADRFIQIHRSYIVAYRAIQSFEHQSVNLGKVRLPLSKRGHDLLMSQITIVPGPDTINGRREVAEPIGNKQVKTARKKS